MKVSCRFVKETNQKPWEGMKIMGEYRFSVYAKWQLGLSISFDGQIVLGLPFFNIHFSTSKYASGVYILGKEFY